MAPPRSVIWGSRRPANHRTDSPAASFRGEDRVRHGGRSSALAGRIRNARRPRPRLARSVRAMRVLMLAWDFPPASVGGNAAHVHGLIHALAASGHDVVLFTLAHPGILDDVRDDGVRVLRARVDLPWLPEEELVARVASANHHFVQLTQPPRRLGARRRPRQRLAGGVGGRHAGDAPRRAARRHVPRHRVGTPRRPCAARRAEHDPRRRVVAGPSRLRGGGQLAVHAPRGHRRLRAASGAGPPHPQRDQSELVGEGRNAGPPHAVGVHVGSGAVREGLPGARAGGQLAPLAGAGDRVHHRRARQLPPRAAVADRPRGSQRPRRPARVPG